MCKGGFIKSLVVPCKYLRISHLDFQVEGPGIPFTVSSIEEKRVSSDIQSPFAFE